MDTSTSLPPKPSRSSRRPYTYRLGSDGCDQSWDIVSKETGSVVAAFGFWDARRKAEAKAKRLTSVRNAAEFLSGIAAIRSGRGREDVYLYPAISEVIDEALNVRVTVLEIPCPFDE